jgi:DNA gyrase subunit A
MSGDAASAFRYTESRLNKFTEEFLLTDINSNAVDFQKNFDGTTVEPVVLPARLPLVLVNGAYGIGAGGMSSGVPQHSIESVINYTIDLFNNPNKDDWDLIMDNKLLPNYPLGGEIDMNGLREVYTKTGDGKLTLRARIDVNKSRNSLIIKNIPYLKKMDDIMDKIKEIKRNKNKTFPEDLFSDLKNFREIKAKHDQVEIELLFKKDTDLEVAKNNLYKYTGLQDGYSISFNLVKSGEVKNYKSIRAIAEDWIEYRRISVKRIKMRRINELEKRIHIIDAILKVLGVNIDKLVKVVKQSTSKEDTINNIMDTFDLDEVQATYIANLEIYRLNKMEANSLEEERKDKLDKVESEIEYLRDTNKLNKFIVDDLKSILTSRHIQKKIHDTSYNDKGFKTSDVKATIVKKDFVLIATKGNYIKKIKYTGKVQKRGGTGTSIGKLKDGDQPLFVDQVCSTDVLLMFTSDGYMLKTNVYELPTTNLQSLGTNVNKMLGNKNLISIISMTEEEFSNSNNSLVITTTNNLVKRLLFSEINNSRNKSLLVAKLKEDSSVNSVNFINEDSSNVIFMSEQGNVLNLDVNDIPTSKRPTTGISLFNNKGKKELTVIGSWTVNKNDLGLYIITKNGLGKRVTLEQFSKNNRYTVGIMAIKLNEGDEVATAGIYSSDDENLLVISTNKNINTTTGQFPVVLRPAKGVKALKVLPGEHVVSSKII